MDSITITLDVDATGLILVWLCANTGYIPPESERLELQAMSRLNDKIEEALNDLNG